MIWTWLLPGAIKRPDFKSETERRMDFLESVIDDAENGEHIHSSFQRHRYQGLANTPIEKFFYLSFAQGLALLPALRELAHECRFQIERDRAIEIEIAPTRATLKLLTYFPVLILGGAVASDVIPINRNLLKPIPLTMFLISITLQVLGRRWSERIILSVKN
jgi:tight adherence protein B